MSNITEVISNTKAVAKVEKQIRICLEHDFQSIGAGVHVDFDLMLSQRGSDFDVYANTGYTENAKDTDLLVGILNALMTTRSGVTQVRVKSFGLNIDFSTAVTTNEIMERVLDGAYRAGYKVEYRNKDAESRAPRH